VALYGFMNRQIIVSATTYLAFLFNYSVSNAEVQGCAGAGSH
jgi:hypothetical protein